MFRYNFDRFFLPILTDSFVSLHYVRAGIDDAVQSHDALLMGGASYPAGPRAVFWEREMVRRGLPVIDPNRFEEAAFSKEAFESLALHYKIDIHKI